MQDQDLKQEDPMYDYLSHKVLVFLVALNILPK